MILSQLGIKTIWMNRKKYFIVATKLMQNVPRKNMQVSVRPDLVKFRHFEKF